MKNENKLEENDKKIIKKKKIERTKRECDQMKLNEPCANKIEESRQIGRIRNKYTKFKDIS